MIPNHTPSAAPHANFLQALLYSWKSLIHRYTAPVNTTPTVYFSITRPSYQTPLNIENHTTRDFYLDLLHLPPPSIPALQYWTNFLPPQPSFNTAFWKKKHCDITWKIAHRNLGTANSLYCMAVYPTTQCPHCNSVETIEHLLLDCPNLLTFFGQPLTHISTKVPNNTSPLLLHYNYLATSAPRATHLVTAPYPSSTRHRR